MQSLVADVSAPGVARDAEPREIRHRGAGEKDSGGALGETEDRPAPRDDGAFDVEPDVRAAAAVGVHGRGGELRDDAGGEPDAVDPAEKTRVQIPDGVRQHELLQIAVRTPEDPAARREAARPVSSERIRGRASRRAAPESSGHSRSLRRGRHARARGKSPSPRDRASRRTRRALCRERSRASLRGPRRGRAVRHRGPGSSVAELECRSSRRPRRQIRQARAASRRRPAPDPCAADERKAGGPDPAIRTGERQSSRSS